MVLSCRQKTFNDVCWRVKKEINIVSPVLVLLSLRKAIESAARERSRTESEEVRLSWFVQGRRQFAKRLRKMRRIWDEVVSLIKSENLQELERVYTPSQRPTLFNGHCFFVPTDSPYVHSYLNLSTTATSPQRQRPLKCVPAAK